MKQNDQTIRKDAWQSIAPMPATSQLLVERLEKNTTAV